MFFLGSGKSCIGKKEIDINQRPEKFLKLKVRTSLFSRGGLALRGSSEKIQFQEVGSSNEGGIIFCEKVHTPQHTMDHHAFSTGVILH